MKEQDNTKALIKVYETINQDLILDQIDQYDEDEIIRVIISRVEYLLNNDKELLMSFLYRLDIPYERVQAAIKITKQVPLHVSIGLLIYHRQLERIRTKLKYKPPILGEDWEPWA